MKYCIYKYILPLSLLPICTLLLASVGGCSPAEKKDPNADVERMYMDEIRSLESFTKRISTAKDTAAVDSLFRLASEAIDNINAKNAPEADMRLTEGQNDTLQIKINALIASRHQRIKYLLQRRDTVSTAPVSSRRSIR